MVTEVVTCDGYLLKRLAMAGLSWLESHQETVNQLNVFPVPDGDTGTNMFLTMRKACEVLTTSDEPHVGKVCASMAEGALLGARGNSGVILSQWWRGFAEAVESHSAFDAELFAQACRNAVERSYKAVVKPVEGTILTVTRQSMEAVTEQARSEDDLYRLFEVKVKAAYDALQRTPELLPVLKQAGVVDSGGQGWLFIIEGMLRVLRGEDFTLTKPSVAVQSATWQEALIPEDEEGYGYDVQFLMHGANMDVDFIRQTISDMGWSTLVVGSPRLIKVHVHVHDPGVPLSYAVKQCDGLADIVVENMQMQYHEYIAGRAERETDPLVQPVDGIPVIAVVPGPGFQRVFREWGVASIIPGGQTMNPSTGDFLKAITALPNPKVILLPNNPNIVLAARQAATSVTDKQVSVVPSRSLPQGIAAMLEYGNLTDLDDVVALADQMTSAMSQVVTVEITTATRSVSLDGIEVLEGDYIGLINDQLKASGNVLDEVVIDSLGKAGADKHELITVYYGEQVSEDQAQALVAAIAEELPDLTIEVVNGGQPLYPYIMSVE